MITESLLRKLIALVSGEVLKSSECKGTLFQDLLKEGLLIPIPCGRGFIYSASDKNSLRNFLSTYDDRFRNLEETLKLLKLREGAPADSVSEHRAFQASLTGNSKLVKTRSCKGFLANSYEPVECKLNGIPFVVNPPSGSFVFIADYENFIPPKDAIVVGIENMENFHFVRSQKKLFREISENAPLLFVSRYPQSGDLVKWLKNIPNRYVHFGDLDLAGIHIYQSEFYAHLGERASFFIPLDAEERIANGSKERYDNQIERFEKMELLDSRVEKLAKLIRKYHRGYDQEGYIETEP